MLAPLESQPCSRRLTLASCLRAPARMACRRARLSGPAVRKKFREPDPAGASPPHSRAFAARHCTARRNRPRVRARCCKRSSNPSRCSLAECAREGAIGRRRGRPAAGAFSPPCQGENMAQQSPAGPPTPTQSPFEPSRGHDTFWRTPHAPARLPPPCRSWVEHVTNGVGGSNHHAHTTGGGAAFPEAIVVER